MYSRECGLVVCFVCGQDGGAHEKTNQFILCTSTAFIYSFKKISKMYLARARKRRKNKENKILHTTKK